MGLTTGIIGAAASAASAANSIANSGGGGEADQAGMQANMYRQQAADLWNNVEPPTLPTTPYNPYQWKQDYTPEVYDPTIIPQATWQDDQKSLDSENQALAQFEQWAKGGLQPADLMALHQIGQQQQGAATSQNAAAMDALRQRGLGGSGAELASQLAGNQGAANTSSNLYANALKAALDRQTNAVSQAGTMAGNIRNQTDSISKQMADATNAFNNNVMGMRTNASINAANVRNAAQQANIQGRQGIANQNTDIGNKNIDLTRTIPQQTFQNLTSILSNRSNALTGQATAANAQQAALATQALGQNQALMGMGNTLVNAGKMFAGDNNTSGKPAPSNSLWNSVFGDGSSGGAPKTPQADSSGWTTPAEDEWVLG